MSLPAALAFTAFGSTISTLGERFTGITAPPRERSYAYRENRTFPNALPPLEMVIRAYQLGELNEGEATQLATRLGVAFPARSPALGELAKPGEVEFTDGEWDTLKNLWDRVITANFAYPAPGETLELLNRQIINEGTARFYLKSAGIHNQPAQTQILRLRQQIPPMSDLIQFAVRDVWQPDVVARFGYDLEFPQPFSFWMGQLGYNWDSRTPVQKIAGLPVVNWPEIYWRSHWTTISKSEGFEMYQRLRPGRPVRLRPDLPPVQPFTLDDLRTILKVHDYPPIFRDQLAAIAYRKPRLIDVDRWYKTRIVERPEAKELYLDLGYQPDLAELRLRWLDSTTAEGGAALGGKAQSRWFGKARTTILEAYRTGALSKDKARQTLVDLGRAEIRLRGDMVPGAALGAIDELRITNRAARELDLVDTEETVADAKALHASIKTRFLRGMLSKADARKALIDGGFDGGRVDSFVARWQYQLDGPRMIFSTQKIQQLVAKGIVPGPQAEVWLKNLGWTNQAVAYMLVESTRDLALAQARAAEKAAKNKAQEQHALKAQIKEGKAAVRDAERSFARSGTPAQLKRWVVKGVITPQTMAGELARQGFPADGIARQIAEANVDRADYLEKAQARAQKRIEASNGQA